MFRLGASHDLKVGARFVRSDDPDTIWTVRQVVELAGLPQHVHIESGGPHRRRVLVSSVVLHDRRQYRLVKEPPVSPPSIPTAPPRPRGWRSRFGW